MSKVKLSDRQISANIDFTRAVDFARRVKESPELTAWIIATAKKVNFFTVRQSPTSGRKKGKLD
ncbi:hypothetical protein [Hufsiella ginkgonis]|uniref:Uncharacterized protein n=1 Tax=Hufsiella ginkgonis TaxID=2695274 RepID=A0A7K1XSA8_9SPHI|nr:hypothetical protein [Hufsiella ginkgonis]MXV13891.1 hypothetical protein [Hufsiella ginkgonis]